MCCSKLTAGAAGGESANAAAAQHQISQKACAVDRNMMVQEAGFGCRTARAGDPGGALRGQVAVRQDAPINMPEYVQGSNDLRRGGCRALDERLGLPLDCFGSDFPQDSL